MEVILMKQIITHITTAGLSVVLEAQLITKQIPVFLSVEHKYQPVHGLILLT